MRYLLAGIFLLASCQSLAARNLTEIVAAGHRTPDYVARDVHRHPLATLEFFGLKPQQVVVEVWPIPGYYTEILAPYLREQGRYYAASFGVSQAVTPQWRHERQSEFLAKLKAAPGLYDKVIVTELGPISAWEPAPANSTDLVLTFRNVHNWMKGEYEREMFTAFFKTLRPGGVLGVVEHRARPGTSREQMIKSGYVTEAYVIEQATAAGFKLAGRSEINANAKDDTQHPEGVWTLPPSLRLGDQDRAKYLAIGESDRMTLKFVKPRKGQTRKSGA